MKKSFFTFQNKGDGEEKTGDTDTSAKWTMGNDRAGLLRRCLLRLTAILVALMVTLTLAGVFPASAEPKKTIVLVHGGWQGAWCWAKVVPYLQQFGHKVVIFDLPGQGSDKTPHDKISLKVGTDRVVEILDEQSEPVVLVGHSSFGVLITQAAEHRPEKIDTLVYLAAVLPKNGQSSHYWTGQIKDSLVGQAIRVDPKKRTMFFRKEAAREALYGDVSDADVKWAKSLLRHGQPLAYVGTPVKISDDRFGKVRRVYVKTLLDRAIPPSLQDNMIKESPVEKVYEINSSHSPFLSKPEELARILSSM